jgi:hypothetical protein
MGMYECHGWTDKFQLFQFSFSLSRIQSSKSVRPYGGPEPKKRDGQTQTDKHTDPIGGNTFNGKEFALEFIHSMATKICFEFIHLKELNDLMQCNPMHCNTSTCGVLCQFVSLRMVKRIRCVGLKSWIFLSCLTASIPSNNILLPMGINLLKLRSCLPEDLQSPNSRAIKGFSPNHHR